MRDDEIASVELIDQFRSMDLSTRLWGINRPQTLSLVHEVYCFRLNFHKSKLAYCFLQYSPSVLQYCLLKLYICLMIFQYQTKVGVPWVPEVFSRPRWTEISRFASAAECRWHERKPLEISKFECVLNV